MFGEDELLPLSGLQHMVFCERQWALIHIEQQWAENRLTAEGRLLHDVAHTAGSESRPGVTVHRGLALRSLRLGLSGQADVVEFRGSQPFPVEYKRGKPKEDASDRIQLCAQALCLEEMLSCVIPAGALFYGTTRRRLDVPFDSALRRQVEGLAQRMHELYRQGLTPHAEEMPKCRNCSLIEVCLPHSNKKASAYVERRIRGAMEEKLE
jgi:CRISPR-associated exonuclease Cas4